MPSELSEALQGIDIYYYQDKKYGKNITTEGEICIEGQFLPNGIRTLAQTRIAGVAPEGKCIFAPNADVIIGVTPIRYAQCRRIGTDSLKIP